MRVAHRLERSVVFDADDTLWHTQELYEDAKRDFAALLQPIEPDSSFVLRRLAEAEARNVVQLGFNRRRFPASMVQTYHSLVTERGATLDGVLSIRASQIGESVFTRIPALRKGAVEALAALESRHRLLMFTAGDESVQRLRIHRSGLRQFFEAVHIVEEKTLDAWSSLVVKENLRPEITWSVGNSIRSDINPARGLGFRCVVLEAGTWEYENAELVDHPGAMRVWRAHDLDTVARIILSEDDRAPHSPSAGRKS